MNSGITTQCLPRMQLLTVEQIQEIHRASLEVLETVGVRVMHDQACEMLAGAGCRVDKDGLVRIPNWLVEESIRNAPSRITIYNRLGEQAMRLEGREIHYGLGTDLIETVDLETGRPRPSVLQDVVNAAILVDHCQEIDFGASYALPGDVPTNTAYIHNFRAQVENSRKPIFFTAAGQQDLAAIIDIAAAVAGGADALRQKPFLIHYSEPTPPLQHSVGAVNKLLLCAERGVPICYTPAAILGGTAPVSIAGGVVQTNAEALSGLVLHQLAAKGAPIISGFGLSPMDMRTTCISYTAPELRLANSALADLYHYYQIPTWSTIGSDSHCLDEQAAVEQGMLILMAALDGANLIHDVGYLGQGLLGNPAMLVLSNEIISYVKRIIRGFDISREMLAVDVIKEVGPGGNYLSVDHTLRNFRNLLWQQTLMNRDNPVSWRANGSRTYGELLVQRAKKILATHRPELLPASVLDEIAAVVQKADHDLRSVHFAA